MAMDSNYVVVGYGVSSDDPNVVLPLKMDVVSGRLMCKNVGSSGDGIVRDNALRDDNYVPTAMGARSDNGNPTPININPSNNGWMLKGN
jgi:hypothetical protein